MSAYATQQDILEAVAQDSQARLSNDPLSKWQVGIGDGVVTVYTTPFLGATTVTGYVDGVTATLTLQKGTGPNGVDQVTFAVAPAAGKAVTVAADKDAINATVISKALAEASGTIDRYLSRYAKPITDAQALSELRGVCIVIAKYRLRGRRDLAAADPLKDSYREALKWLELVGMGKLQLPVSVPEPTVTVADGIVEAEEAVFDAPSDWSSSCG